MWQDQFSGRDIVLISPQQWRGMWVSKHWIASELSKHNRVLFVEPPVWMGGLIRRPWQSRHEWSRLRHREKVVNPNLKVFVPFLWPGWSGKPDVVAQVAAKVRSLGFERTILLNFGTNHRLIGRVNDAARVYYCVDPAEEGEEREVCRKSDLIYAVSEAYGVRLAQHGSNAPISVTPHGYPVEYAQRVLADEACTKPADLQRFRGPIVGFVGSIHDSCVDLQLVEHISRARPNYDFVLVGPYKRNPIGGNMSREGLRRLKRLKNVHLLGFREFWEVPKYVKHFDACMVLIDVKRFEQRLHMRQRTLFKWLLYLSQGKPVVAPGMDEVRPIADMLYLAQDDDEYASNIDAALKEATTDPVRKRRMEYAQQFSFEKTLEKIVAPICEFEARAASPRP